MLYIRLHTRFSGLSVADSAKITTWQKHYIPATGKISFMCSDNSEMALASLVSAGFLYNKMSLKSLLTHGNRLAVDSWGLGGGFWRNRLDVLIRVIYAGVTVHAILVYTRASLTDLGERVFFSYPLLFFFGLSFSIFCLLYAVYVPFLSSFFLLFILMFFSKKNYYSRQNVRDF